MPGSIKRNWGRGALAAALVLAAVSACGGDDGPHGGAANDAAQSPEVNLKGKTLAHHVQLRGHNGENGLRRILKTGQKYCVEAKEMAEGITMEDPEFPPETQLVAGVEQDIYYTQHARISYDKNYAATMDKETCDVKVPTDPTSVRVHILDGKGGCNFNVSAGGATVCALSREGYRRHPSESSSARMFVTQFSKKGDDGCMEVDYKSPMATSTQRQCILLRNDGWTSYPFFGTDLAGIYLEYTSALNARFDDPESILWHFEAGRVETDIMVPNDIIYPHLSGKYNTEFILLEDERHPFNWDDDDDEDEVEDFVFGMSPAPADLSSFAAAASSQS